MANLLSISQLSDLTGKSNRTIKKRLDESDIKDEKGPNGNGKYYNSKEALEVIYRADFALDLGGGEYLHLDQERAKQARAQSEKINLEIKKIKKEYFPLDAICEEVNSQFSAIRIQLENLPSRMTNTVPFHVDPEDKVKLKVAFKKEMNVILKELSMGKIENAQ